jgi:hypothetical protein
MRRHVLIPAVVAAAAMALTGCSSDGSDASTDTTAESTTIESPSAEASTPEATDAPAAGGDGGSVSSEEWLSAVTEAEAAFLDSAGDRALRVQIEVTDTQEGSVTADSTYNPDDTFVATSNTTTPLGTIGTMRVACTVEACYYADENGEWTQTDRSAVERPEAGALAVALKELESSGSVVHTIDGSTYTVELEIPEAEGQPGGTASLVETISDTELATTLIVKIGEDASTTSSTTTFVDPAPLPNDLP